nr:acetamidase/formamidase family protein [Sphingomonas sp. Y57]
MEKSASPASAPVIVGRPDIPADQDMACFNRLHYAIPFAATADPGQAIVFQTRDCIDGQMTFGAPVEQMAGLNLGRVHPMTGPVEIRGAEPGDAIAITIDAIEPAPHGVTMIAPGFSFLRDLFVAPAVVHWRLEKDFAVSDSLPGIRVPIRPFPGSMGVLPDAALVADALSREAELRDAGGIVMLPDPDNALPHALFGAGSRFESEGLRTIPPREFGGNMDTSLLAPGSTLVVPVSVPGAGVWCGDVHFAQGDGEVCGSAIEIAARVHIRCEVRKGEGRGLAGPVVEGFRPAAARRPVYATMGFPTKQAGELPPHLDYVNDPRLRKLRNLSEDVTLAARNALLNLIDWLCGQRGLSRDHAYILCSAAADLRIAQVVDSPNVMVTAEIPLDIFHGAGGAK